MRGPAVREGYVRLTAEEGLWYRQAALVLNAQLRECCRVLNVTTLVKENGDESVGRSGYARFLSIRKSANFFLLPFIASTSHFGRIPLPAQVCCPSRYLAGTFRPFNEDEVVPPLTTLVPPSSLAKSVSNCERRCCKWLSIFVRSSSNV